ncbi:CapA family protein [Vibrio sp. J1-1]|uniref:CapA family protein n=1 Tax=Vibrio sp. J1-1 TaxID=2912251 RepID=UPI001F42C169|nr:CapA family protein [Vibrio sp. J1-1]MCF7482054.1 CapA family protein [Vibrio sp. J1-1]
MLSILGDVYLDDTYKLDLDFKNVIINLEYPLYNDGEPSRNKVNLGVNRPNLLDTFKSKPLAVCLANNHIMDYGNSSFEKTIRYLNSENIKFYGAGSEENNYNNPSIIECGNKKIALLGYCCPSTHPNFGGKGTNGVAEICERRISKDIDNTKKNSDFVIVQLHWGDEEISVAKPKDVNLARKIIDLGADLIIGHHAHVIQPVELYKGKSIYYGLGNFIFPDLDVPSHYDGNKFLGRYIKKQNSYNKKSIVVELREDLKSDFYTTKFDGERVYKSNTKIPNFKISNEKHYYLYKKLFFKSRSLVRFLKSPKVPSKSQLKSFIRF